MECVFLSESSSCITAVYRLGNRYVNWYLVDSTEGLLIIDTGLAGQWPQLPQAVAQLGKRLTDISYILLTHAHPDHLGTAERIRRESEAPVWIHQRDAAAATTSQAGPPPARLLLNVWRPAVMKMVATMMRQKAMQAQPVGVVRPFSDAETLAIPGAPVVIHVPGHTPGSCAFYFKEDQVLFSGDELVTFDLPRAKKSPPTLAPGEDEMTMRLSLSRLGFLEQVLLLPGHGDPWRGDMAQAIQQASS